MLSRPDTGLDRRELLELYDQAFGRVTVSSATRSGGKFSPVQVANLALSLAASATLAHAMGRERGAPSAGAACLPHLTLTLTAESCGPPPSVAAALDDAVRAGAPLSACQKAALLALEGKRARAARCVAWVANRCASTMSASRRAALPVCFCPLVGGRESTEKHFNLLVFTFEEERGVSLELFEPNGLEAYEAGGLASVFDDIGAAIRGDRLSEMRFRLRPVGSGLQTDLGEWFWSRSRAGGGVARLARGYPICSAVCVWAFTRLLAGDFGSVECLDAALHEELTLRGPERRYELQRDIREYIRRAAAWNDGPGREALREALVAHFHGTNVLELRVARARGVRPLTVRFAGARAPARAKK